MKISRVIVLILITGLFINIQSYSQTKTDETKTKFDKQKIMKVFNKVLIMIDSKDFKIIFRTAILDACKDSTTANQKINENIAKLMEDEMVNVITDAGFKDKTDFEQTTMQFKDDAELKQFSVDIGMKLLELIFKIIDEKDVAKVIPQDVKKNFEMIKQMMEQQNAKSPAK